MLISIRNNRHTYLLIFALALLFCGCKSSAELPHSVAPPTTLLSNGDLAFRLGRTMQSNLIASSGNDTTSYSHIGIVVFQEDRCCVVHIEPQEETSSDEICCEPIEEFFSTKVATAGAVMRHRDLSTSQRVAINAHAEQLLQSKITFDHDYLFSDTTTMYCTELAEHIYASMGISLSQGRRHSLLLVTEPLILPSDIAQNPDLYTSWSFDYSALRPAR